MKSPFLIGRSVAVMVVFIIVITVSLLTAVAGTLAYRYTRDKAYANFDRSRDNAADQLQVALTPTLWNLDYPQIGKQMESRLLDEHLRAVVVVLEDRQMILIRSESGKVEPAASFSPGDLLETRRTIEYSGQTLGQLQLYASPAAVERELAQARSYLAGFGLLLAAVLSMLLYLLVARLILRPLRVVERYAEGISRGEPQTADLGSIRFVGEIDSLKHSIDRMIRELKLRNDELARHRGHLEELVAARTVELQQTVAQLEETQFAMNHAGIAIQWIDAASGRLLYVNERACMLYGYERDALLAMQAGDLVPDLDPGRLRALLPQLEGEGRATIESEALTRQGTLPVETSIYLQAAGDGCGSHFITFTTDIGQRKAVERALIAAKAAAEAAARTRSEFLANMSHEIRTPMNAIIGMSQLALNTELNPKQRNYIEKVHQSAGSLLGVLNDILDFSKVEAGRLDIEHVEFDMEEMLANVGNIVGLRAEEKGLDFLIEFAADTPTQLIGDPMRIGQVLINLAGNAIKFTEKGSVVISVKSLFNVGDGTVLLEFGIRDTGIGIEPSMQEHLFSAFTQADASISRRFGGTGLGLAISKRLVHLMGGDISVSSRPGIGSHFRFTVRLELSPTLPPMRRLPEPLRGLQVLVVDDCNEAREIIAAIVSQFGMLADAAASGEAALEAIGRRNYDLLICDWKMPGMDGLELVRRLRDLRKDDELPAVIMVSAYGVEKLRVAARGLPLAGILPKPASPSTIFDVILTAFGHDAGLVPGSAGSALPSPERYRHLRDAEVLLVEDNLVNQELASDLLATVGVRVTLAENGQQALDLLAPGRFACVLMDVQMPVMDGLEATRRIRRDPRYADLPVIAMTAGAMAEEKAQTHAAGMNAHVTKPLNFAELLDVLSEQLGHCPQAQPQSQGSESKEIEASVLDTAFGLDVSADNPTLYSRLLRHFLNGYERRQSGLANAIALNDPKSLLQEAHATSGSAATVGAHDTARCAKALETACKKGASLKECDALVTALRDADYKASVAVADYLGVAAPPDLR